MFYFIDLLMFFFWPGRIWIHNKDNGSKMSNKVSRLYISYGWYTVRGVVRQSYDPSRFLLCHGRVCLEFPIHPFACFLVWSFYGVVSFTTLSCIPSSSDYAPFLPQGLFVYSFSTSSVLGSVYLLSTPHLCPRGSSRTVSESSSDPGRRPPCTSPVPNVRSPRNKFNPSKQKKKKKRIFFFPDRATECGH